MLLTYPTKESMIRNLNEFGVNEVFIIIANYKSLAGWNLIPLRRLSLFLGPNSAGKSLIYEAIIILRRLDLIGNDAPAGKWWTDLSGSYEGMPSFGFSMPYILNGSLASFDMMQLYICASDMASGGKHSNGWGGLGAFFVLEGMQENHFLYENACNIRYTMLTEEIENLEVYLDAELAARKNQHNWITEEYEDGHYTGNQRETTGSEDECDFSFHPKIIAEFYKPAVEYRRATDDCSVSGMDDAGEYYGKNGELDSDEDFIGVINNRNGTFHFKASEFPEFIYHTSAEHNFGSSEAAVGMFLATFTAPYLRFIECLKGQESADVRGMGSHGLEDWVEKRLIASKADLIFNEIQNRTSVDERGLIEKTVESIAKVFAPTDAVDTNLLSALNRWLRESAFLASDYQLHVDLSVSIPLSSGSDDWIVNDGSLHLQNILRKKDDVNGALYLIDKNRNKLRFSDVGAGYSQVFPLLVGLLARIYLIFKQPELHLHPRMQSRVADCFVETIFNDRQNGLSKIRIIETHSEHFVLRLLRRLRESSFDELFHSSLTLYPSDVAFVYFEPTKDGTLVHLIEVIETGEFVEGWPNGFFDERDEDLWGIPSAKGL
jgi:hypothetical protein